MSAHTHTHRLHACRHQVHAYTHATTHHVLGDSLYVQKAHSADLFVGPVVMKVVAVEADEGAIYCVYFPSRVAQEGKD